MIKALFFILWAVISLAEEVADFKLDIEQILKQGAAQSQLIEQNVKENKVNSAELENLARQQLERQNQLEIKNDPYIIAAEQNLLKSEIKADDQQHKIKISSIATKNDKQKHIVKHCQSANKPFNKCFKYLHDIKLKTLPAEYREIEQFRCKLDFSQIVGIEGDFAYHHNHPTKIYFRHNYTMISLPVFSVESTNKKWPINFWYVKSGWVNDEGVYFVERYPGNPLTLDDSINDQRCPTKYRKPFIAKELVRPEQQVIERIIYQDNCDFLKNQPQCSLLSERCLEQGAKEIKGINVEQCLKYELNYDCDLAATEDQSCQALKQNPHCSHIEAKCINQQDGFCSKYQHSYHCFSEDDIAEQQQANNEIDIIHLQVKSVYEEQVNDEIGDVLSQLQLASEVKNDNQHDLKIFTGTAEQCQYSKVLGGAFSDCCDGKKKIGQKLNLAKCTPKEKLLMERQQLGTCILVDQTANKKWGGVKKEYINHYCCFGSKLQQLMGVEARKQLQIGWNNCRGLTLNELSDIDMKLINFGEIANDIMSKSKISSANYQIIQQSLTNKVQGMLKEKNHGDY